MIKLQTYSINQLLLNNEVLGAYINNFWNDIFTSIKTTKHLMLMCKVEFKESELGYRTLGDLRRVNFDDKELFVEYLINRLGLLNESYTSQPISKITFTYIIKNGLATDNRRLLQDLSANSIAVHRFNNMNLPITMNPADYGTIKVDNYVVINGESVHRLYVVSGNRSYLIDVSKDGLINNVSIEGIVDLRWTDTKLSDDLFKREVGKSIIYFLGGEKILRKKLLNAKPINKVSTDTTINTEFVTMDIETIRKDGKLTPYLICGYNGTNYITSYADRSLTQSALFTSFINQLLTFFTKESNTMTVYAHNFSAFDGVFLFNKLLEFGKVTPKVRDGKIISIKLKLDIKGYKNKTIIFKDSYLLLTVSLRNLCLAFGVDAAKSYFPFNLNNIFYTGVFPKFEHWTGINLSEYENLLKSYTGVEWNFKAEAIKYCKLDCLALHQILVKFNELIFTNFKLNIDGSLTLPSLAFNIYRSQFMPENTIFQLLGGVESDIRQSYTGGAVDVYIPHNRITGFLDKVEALFKQLYYYDVNSLYPTIMAKTYMPVGKPIAFEGDIRKVEPSAFGFFYCKITSPEYIKHPILQKRIKTSDGYRTIAGLGSWTGWIFSLEMDNAMKFGYTFEIIKGYEFKKGNIFKEYIETMYNLRLKYPKGDAMNLIAKLLMNSLYGKFGMRLENTIIEVFNKSNNKDKLLLENMLEAHGPTIQDFITTPSHILTVRKSLLSQSYSQDEEMYHGLDVNIALASAITGGARMWMSILKNTSKFNLYYSDTDSVVTDTPLPSFLIGDELGQFKLEYTIKRAVFLAPKVYGLITTEGKEIIKIKGLSNLDLQVKDLELLLIKDSSKEFIQEKWFKRVIQGDITPKDVAYNLKVTSNKRAPIFINNVYSNTKPYYYDEINTK